MDNSTHSVTAHAKVNLALHVTGQRNDGYHLIDSLVGFADFGDQISAKLTDENSFEICGPFAPALKDEDENTNLIIKARDALAEFASENGIKIKPVSLVCEKNLPVASGLGGGSADAGAALNLLTKLWQLEISESKLTEIALGLGADVPMCLKSEPLIAKGIGEELTSVRPFPKCHIVLANPMVAVSTPVVFKALKTKQNVVLKSELKFSDFQELLATIKANRNDLQEPAIEHRPIIAECLNALLKTNPACARMSGSGASCFALYDNEDNALAAAQTIIGNHHNWFVKPTFLRAKN
ncbi:MAG: 4-(cytidine 5'-diphospho)-2-C-methyl-D-erythritol kinase [Rhizobiaceae bacterium]|nr:4-(cytidine 5'-diphospho)-2-C-methyl-D-erythritol kinase [Rhizobiaceae bacterium]